MQHIQLLPQQAPRGFSLLFCIVYYKILTLRVVHAQSITLLGADKVSSDPFSVFDGIQPLHYDPHTLFRWKVMRLQFHSVTTADCSSGIFKNY